MGGKQFSMKLETNDTHENSLIINNKNKEKTKEIQLTEEDLPSQTNVKKDKTQFGINLTTKIVKK